jgi:hypothetical protein
MISIDIENAKVINEKKDDTNRWMAQVALNLTDETVTPSRPISEWFYALVCNEAYLENPIDKADLRYKQIFIVQDKLNVDTLVSEVTERLHAMKAETWEEAFGYLERYYLHDD